MAAGLHSPEDAEEQDYLVNTQGSISIWMYGTRHIDVTKVQQGH